ncbi:phage tail protein [Enterobacter asburiae]|uniref:phage tail fiber protein n=1 Tax=Enterobacter asburiae TaxID=61645 RepID=UPI0028EBB206|nr:phage tail protein [Enterobacter asburiae]WNS34755.1 phage tail protein [Enterobacter asburiae]
MSAGTITLTNGSAVVGGSGTSFSTELAAGDFIVSTVGGVPYTLPVKTVDSGTHLTLVSNFTGPTQSGAAWSAVPRVAMNMVTAALVAQSAEALRGLNYDKQNWQSIFSGTGNVTVTLPDGTTWTGPAWNSITTSLNSITTSLNSITTSLNNITTSLSGKAEKGANSDITSISGLTTALSVAQGGTGSTTASGARQNLGLGTAATKDTGTASGQVLLAGAAFGLGSNLASYSYSQPTGFYTGQQDAPTPGYGGGCIRMSSGNYQVELYSPLAGPVRFFARNINTSTGGSAWAEYYSTANTTKASDGTLKAASPVARIVKSQEENQRSDIADDGFLWCGCGTANAEAEGISISRTDVGVYILAGSEGLASEGWQLLPPMDPGGMGELGIVEAEQADNGELTIRLFKRKYMLGDDGEIVKTKGEPIDVPANSWIDVRLDMRESSIWNRHRKQEIEADNQIPGS